MTEKILKRLKQKRTEAAAMFVGAPEPVALQDHGEKILGEILRFLHGVTLTTYEQKTGRQYVRQSSASASRAFCSSTFEPAAERIRLQCVVPNPRGSAKPQRAVSDLIKAQADHCRILLQA